MIAQELEVSLHMAFVEARQQRHEFITVEHLLLALLDNPSAAEVLRACAANIEDLRTSLSNFIKDNTPQVSGTDEVDTQPTLGFQRVIQRAIMHVQSTGNGKKEVTGANVLVAIFGEKDSHAVYYLHQQGVTRLDVVNFIAHGIRKSEPPEPPKNEGKPEGEQAPQEEGEGQGGGAEEEGEGEIAPALGPGAAEGREALSRGGGAPGEEQGASHQGEAVLDGGAPDQGDDQGAEPGGSLAEDGRLGDAGQARRRPVPRQAGHASRRPEDDGHVARHSQRRLARPIHRRPRSRGRAFRGRPWRFLPHRRG